MSLNQSNPTHLFKLQNYGSKNEKGAEQKNYLDENKVGSYTFHQINLLTIS
jgi:hypothetical protein